MKKIREIPPDGPAEAEEWDADPAESTDFIGEATAPEATPWEVPEARSRFFLLQTAVTY